MWVTVVAIQQQAMAEVVIRDRIARKVRIIVQQWEAGLMRERGLEVRGIKALVKVVEVHTVIILLISVLGVEPAGIAMETMTSPPMDRVDTEELDSWVVMVKPVLLMTTVDSEAVAVRVVTEIVVAVEGATPEEVVVWGGQARIGVVAVAVAHI